MRKRQIFAILLASSICLSACGSKESAPTPGNIDSTSDSNISETTEVVNVTNNTTKAGNVITLADIKEKYGVTTKDLGVSPLYNVDEDAKFTFHFNSLVDPFQAVTVHTDRECGVNSTIYTMNSSYFTKDGGIDVIVDRFYTPTLNVKDRLDYDSNLNSWGHAAKYYLSINYDMDATVPTKLDEPIVIPFTIKNDVDVPSLNYEITNYGEFKLVWDAVDGADGYRIYENYNSEKPETLNRERGYVGLNLKLVGTVDGNTTEYLVSNDSTQGSYYYLQNSILGDDYYVTAVKDGKESNFGLEVGVYRYYNQLPSKVDESVLSIGTTFTTLPETVPVVMKDGSKTNLPIDFKLKDDTYKNLGEVTYEYHVQGTKLGGEVKYKLPESGEYEELVKSKATFDTALYKTKLDLSALGDSSFPVVNDGKTTETDLTKLKEYNPNSRVVYDSTALNKRLDIEMARLVTNGVYTVDPNSIKVVDFSDRQNDLKEREKQLGDIFTVNSTSKRDVSEPTTVETTESDNWWESVEPTAGADVTDSSDDAWWKHVESETESTTDNVTEAEETVIEAVTETTEEIDATKKDDTDVVDAGNVIDKKLESDENKIDEGDSIELNSTNYYVYADSAEEEYLALSFINQEDMIRIDIFPSLMDTDILSDVINKVYYQNPYFLGAVSLSVGMDEAGAVYLLPEYKYSKEDALSMQKEIYSTATNVLGSIIRANMSDEEKLEAIWNYLDDNTVYDYAACDNAVANDFHASLDYADSFNTYGILVKRVGVCQSYAYTMDLLLSMSGVDCITLTGYSNKTMPHAWNAVNLGGKYYWVDATANYDYTCIPYFLYTTSSDYAMDNGYSLDNGYLLDNELSIVYNSDENKDWYYVHNRVVKSDADLVQAIAEGWDEATKITYAIRLDYDLNITDDLVSAIVNELYSAGVSKTDLVNNFDLYTCGNYVIVTKDREAFESKLSQS